MRTSPCPVHAARCGGRCTPDAGTLTASWIVAQAVAAVPVGERFVRVLRAVALGRTRGDLAPWRGVIEHDVVTLRGLRQRGIYRGGEGVHQLRVARREESEEAPAQPAEVALRLAGRHLVRVPAIVELRVVDAEVIFALDLQGAGERPEVYGVAATSRRLAADRAVAAHKRVGLRRLNAESDRSAMAATFE